MSPKRKRVADSSKWFEKGSDECLVRETLESLAVWEDPEKWLRRLAMLRELLPQERRDALHAQKNPPSFVVDARRDVG